MRSLCRRDISLRSEIGLCERREAPDSRTEEVSHAVGDVRVAILTYQSGITRIGSGPPQDRDNGLNVKEVDADERVPHLTAQPAGRIG